MPVSWCEPPPLPGWLAEHLPFGRRVARVGEHRLHFIDEGEGPAVLLVHGNPTWSFLWRKVIARIASEGVRAIAPDLIGFGLSDKPRRLGAHTLAQHTALVRELVEALDPGALTIVGQDWGGPIAAGLAAATPGRVRAAVFGNTALLLPKRPIRTTAFHRLSHRPVLSHVVFYALGYPIPLMHRVQGDPASIGPLEKRAYRFPLRRFRDRAGPLALARMVPDADDHPSIAPLSVVDRWARSFDGPTTLVWGRKDPILGRAIFRLREAMPHAKVIETDAGHFLQEEVPDTLAREVLALAR